MFAVSLRVTERLRDNTDKRKMHRQFPNAMQQPLHHVMRTGR